MQIRLLPLIAAAALAATSACGGGGSAGTAGVIPGGNSTPAPTILSAQRLGLNVYAAAGSVFPSQVGTRTATTSKTTRMTPAAGASVTVSYQGQTVGTGTLNGNGFAELTFTQNVPVGATVTVTVGSGTAAVVATVTLATALVATASEIVYNAGPPATITVTASADAAGNGQVTSSDPQQVTEDEDPSDGKPTNIVSGDDPNLPTNLPVSITTCGGSVITIAPVGTQQNAPWMLAVEEKVHDGDDGSQFTYVTQSFTGPISIPELASAARLHIIIVDSLGNLVLALEAPLDAITGGGATQTPAPSASPSSSPSTSPSPSACPTLTPTQPGASPSSAPTMPPMPTPPAEPTDTPEPTMTPLPTPSATPTAMPTTTPMPSASPSASPTP